MASSAKVLFIGIDAADKDLILKWTSEGALPTFQNLFNRAAWGATTNPVGLYVGAVWPSFYTGVSPAQHGRYCYTQLQPGSYENQAFRPTDVKAEPFWDALSTANKRVAVIDVPKTFPAKNFNGIHIVDWCTHDPDYPKLVTWPASLEEEVSTRFGRDSIGDCNGKRDTAADFFSLRDALVERVAKKAEISGHFLAQGKWDCFLTVFSESHCVGHQCWHLRDPGHPRYDANLAQVVGDPVKDVYRAIDQAIAKLIAKVGPETMIIVLASHGMGPHYDASFMLDRMLQRLERVHSPRAYPRLAQVLKWAWNRLPRKLTQRYRPLKSKVKQLGLDAHASRKYFTVPNNDVYGGIRINLAGREPQGKVQPGAEFDKLCESLTRDLLTFVNQDTGEPLVKSVLKTAELYQGAYLDHLPDLMVEWYRDAPITRVYSPLTGEIQGVFKGCRTGDHKPEGLFFIAGPSVRPGPLETPVSVMDFAPTIASELGVTLPRAEGRSIVPLIGI